SGNSKITGGNGTVTGAGGLAVNTYIIGAKGDSITGSGGSTSINGLKGLQFINAGAGPTTVLSGTGDTITGGSGTLTVQLDNDQSTSFIGLGPGHGAATLRDISVIGS